MLNNSAHYKFVSQQHPVTNLSASKNREDDLLHSRRAARFKFDRAKELCVAGWHAHRTLAD